MSTHIAQTGPSRGPLYFAIMAILLLAVGFVQSWSVSLAILNLCLISAIMALGVNIQWGYAGIFNVGMMGFAAVGGVGAVLVSQPPEADAWAAGGMGLGFAVLAVLGTVIAALVVRAKMARGLYRTLAVVAVCFVGYFITRSFYDPATNAIEAINPSKAGYLGGLNMPIMVGWIVGAAMAAGVAWLIGKVALGLRSDYLAIATLGISEIVIAVIKNEDWLVRGVKNVTGLDRPVPYEVDLVATQWFIDLCHSLGLEPSAAAGNFVKLCYAAIFAVVLLALVWLSELALNSPWGRMMRAIRDNEAAAEAMGKDVTGRYLQTFVIGSAVVGLAGAMLTTLDGQFTPGSYNPLRFTFLIWVMVIVGGSGNNWGAVLGGFVIWFVWIEAEVLGTTLMESITYFMADDSPIAKHLVDSAAHMRMVFMGVILLCVMRFAPRGLIPERSNAGK